MTYLGEMFMAGVRKNFRRMIPKKIENYFRITC